MILPNSYETFLDKIKQDWFIAGWDAAMEEVELKEVALFHADLKAEKRRNEERFKEI